MMRGSRLTAKMGGGNLKASFTLVFALCMLISGIMLLPLKPVALAEGDFQTKNLFSPNTGITNHVVDYWTVNSGGWESSVLYPSAEIRGDFPRAINGLFTGDFDMEFLTLDQAYHDDNRRHNVDLNLRFVNANEPDEFVRINYRSVSSSRSVVRQLYYTNDGGATGVWRATATVDTETDGTYAIRNAVIPKGTTSSDNVERYGRDGGQEYWKALEDRKSIWKAYAGHIKVTNLDDGVWGVFGGHEGDKLVAKFDGTNEIATATTQAGGSYGLPKLNFFTTGYTVEIESFVADNYDGSNKGQPIGICIKSIQDTDGTTVSLASATLDSEPKFYTAWKNWEMRNPAGLITTNDGVPAIAAKTTTHRDNDYTGLTISGDNQPASINGVFKGEMDLSFVIFEEWVNWMAAQRWIEFTLRFADAFNPDDYFEIFFRSTNQGFGVGRHVIYGDQTRFTSDAQSDITTSLLAFDGNSEFHWGQGVREWTSDFIVEIKDCGDGVYGIYSGCIEKGVFLDAKFDGTNVVASNADKELNTYNLPKLGFLSTGYTVTFVGGGGGREICITSIANGTDNVDLSVATLASEPAFYTAWVLASSDLVVNITPNATPEKFWNPETGNYFIPNATFITNINDTPQNVEVVQIKKDNGDFVDIVQAGTPTNGNGYTLTAVEGGWTVALTNGTYALNYIAIDSDRGPNDENLVNNKKEIANIAVGNYATPDIAIKAGTGATVVASSTGVAVTGTEYTAAFSGIFTGDSRIDFSFVGTSTAAHWNTGFWFKVENASNPSDYFEVLHKKQQWSVNTYVQYQGAIKATHVDSGEVFNGESNADVWRGGPGFDGLNHFEGTPDGHGYLSIRLVDGVWGVYQNAGHQWESWEKCIARFDGPEGIYKFPELSFENGYRISFGTEYSLGMTVSSINGTNMTVTHLSSPATLTGVTLNGESTVTHLYGGAAFVDPGAFAKYTVGVDRFVLTEAVATTDSVNESALGANTLTYTKDAFNASRTVNVKSELALKNDSRSKLAKVYNGSRASTLALTDFDGVVGDGTGLNISYTYSDKNVGINKTLSGEISGANSEWYIIYDITGGEITAKALIFKTDSAAKLTKTYDGETTVSNITIADFDGAIDDDDIGVTLVYANKEAGIGNRVITGTTTGNDSGNYTVTEITNGTINKKALTLDPASQSKLNKTFDDNDLVHIDESDIIGIIPEDDLTVEFKYADKNAGTGIAISGTLDGEDSGNYTLPTGLTGDIARANLTVITVDDDDKTVVYTGEARNIVYNAGGITATVTYYANENDRNNKTNALASAPTDVGTYYVNIYCAETGNNAEAEFNTTFTIIKADIAITADAEQDGTYDGTAKSVEYEDLDGFVVTVAYYASVADRDGKANALASAPVNAGVYYAVISCAGDANHNAASDVNVVLTIAKANVAITAEAEQDAKVGDSIVIDFSVSGGTLAATAVTVTFYANEADRTAQANALEAVPTTAGVYYIRITFAGDNNHNAATTKFVKLTIEAEPVVPGGCNTAGVANGTTGGGMTTLAMLFGAAFLAIRVGSKRKISVQ